jgi:hypothetical protein
MAVQWGCAKVRAHRRFLSRGIEKKDLSEGHSCSGHACLCWVYRNVILPIPSSGAGGLAASSLSVALSHN